MPRITILGWKRERMPELLKLCEDLSFELAKLNISIITGGGGGFMEAGNKGAYKYNKNNSISYGVQKLNEINFYTPPKNKYICENFAIRKSMLLDTSACLIFFPGGVGTLDEFMDTMNLYKTSQREVKPVICVGKKYWGSLREWFIQNDQDFPDKYISLMSEDINEIVNFIKENLLELEEKK
jgi:predicted Rossmann-fold nucleotide-binding protein